MKYDVLFCVWHDIYPNTWTGREQVIFLKILITTHKRNVYFNWTMQNMRTFSVKRRLF